MPDAQPDHPDGSTLDHPCWCGQGSAQREFDLPRPKLGEPTEQYAFWRCLGCGVRFIHPQPSPDELADFYNDQYYGSGRSKFIGPIARLVAYFQQGRSRLVARRVPNAKSDPSIKANPVLDVGCGNGGFLARLDVLGYQVQGTELSAQSASRVPAEIKESIHVGDLTSLSLPEQSYRAICFWHVFEHLHDPHATCRIVHKLLEADGLVFLSLPNQESLQARLFGSHWFHLDPPRHLFGFGPKSMRRLLEMTGFEVLRIHTWSLEQNPYGFAQSFLNAMGFPRDRAYNMLKGLPAGGAAGRILDRILLALLVTPAFIVSSVASILGRGATMTVIAQKRTEDPSKPQDKATD